MQVFLTFLVCISDGVRQMANALNQGRLVPEDVIFRLLSNTLVESHFSGESGFILDGLPQNRFQAVSFWFLCLLSLSFMIWIGS